LLDRMQKENMTLFENSPDPMIVLDLYGNFVMANKRALEIVGKRKFQIIGKHFSEVRLLDVKGTMLCLANFLKRAAGLKVKPYEVEVAGKGGKKIPFQINASLIKVKGKVVGDYVVFRDMTLAREKRRKLEAENRFLEDLMTVEKTAEEK